MTTDAERACPTCGRTRSGDADRCQECGASYPSDPAPDDASRDRAALPTPDAWRGAILPGNADGEPARTPTTDEPRAAARAGAPTWRAVTSPWLVGALVVTTFGLYAFWWAARTWAQIKAEDGDRRKRPVWHALALVVPIYGFFRFHAHIRAIVGLSRTPLEITPLPVTLAWVLVNVLSSTVTTLPAQPWLLLIPLALAGALFGWVQRALNTAWLSLPGGAVPARAHPLHWFVIGAGGLLLLTSLIRPPS